MRVAADRLDQRLVASTTSRSHLPVAVLAAGVVAAVVLHVLADLRYPVPWPDEAHFLAPARNLAAHLTLTAPELNAPSGIFWMPDGYAVLVAVAYALLPDTIEVARLLSLALTLTFAACMYAVGVRLGGARLAVASAIATWLVAPRVVLMANIARMEPLVLALVGAALLLAVSRRWLGALAVASLTVLVHPSGAVVTLALAGVAVLLRTDLRPRGAPEVALVAAAALAWAAEAAWLLANLDLVREHLAFQMARKGARDLGPNSWEVAAAVVAAAGVAGCAAGRRRLGAHRAAVLAALFALVGAFTAVRVAGNEMWYGAVGYETSALLVVLAVAALAPRLRLPAAGAAALATVPVALVIGVTLTGSAYHMAIATGSSADPLFMVRVEQELRDFDARQHQPVMIAFDRSSGLSPFLLDRPWQHLRFVDPTPVTPLRERPDYVLYSLGPPEPGRRRIADRLPQGAPALRVTDPTSTAEVLLFSGELVALPVT